MITSDELSHEYETDETRSRWPVSSCLVSRKLETVQEFVSNQGLFSRRDQNPRLVSKNSIRDGTQFPVPSANYKHLPNGYASMN